MHVNANILHTVCGGKHLRPNHATERLVAREGAAIVDVFRINRQDDPVFVQRDASIKERAFVAVRARLHMLDARLGPFHRASPSLARCQRTDRHVRIACNLDAEAAANVETLHVNLIDAHSEGRREELRRE